MLNHEELNRDPLRITKIETFISKHNREGINLPSEKDDWKKFEKNNINVRNTIALNILYVKKEKVYPAYISKHNSNREKQVFLFMIPNGEEWHFLIIKKISPLFKGTNQNIMVIFIVWIVFIALEQKTNLNHMEKHVKTKIFIM